MDIATVAAETVWVLGPLLPALMAKAGDVATGEAMKKVGSESWELAKGLWEKMRPAVEASPGACEAVNELAATPGDEDARAVLRVQLKKLC